MKSCFEYRASNKKKRKRKRKEAKLPALPEGWCQAWTDGACAGNPGSIGIGVHIEDPDCGVVAQVGEACGTGTNNEAEYLAVLKAVTLAAEKGFRGVRIKSDSELVVKQLKGEYFIGNPRMRILAAKVQKSAQGLPEGFSIHWTPREQNEVADALASRAVDMPQAPVDTDRVHWSPDPEFVPDPEKLAGLPSLKCNLDRFLSRARPKFKDYLELRTGGFDGYSRIKTARALEIIGIRFGEGALEWIEEALGDTINTKYGRNALRWCARGLPPDMALKKASVDWEAENKFKK